MQKEYFSVMHPKEMWFGSIQGVGNETGIGVGNWVTLCPDRAKSLAWFDALQFLLLNGHGSIIALLCNCSARGQPALRENKSKQKARHRPLVCPGAELSYLGATCPLAIIL